MRYFMILPILILLLFVFSPAIRVHASETIQCIYDFTQNDIEGKPVKFEDYKGKVLLIINTASKCGFTPQYKELMELYSKYKEKGLVVLGFPANEFGQQEPGTDQEIQEFCTLNYKVEFPMFSKVCVKGESIEPLFHFLTEQKNPDFTGEIKWNFEKFLIGKDGQLLHRYRSKVKPTDPEIVEAIEQALESKSDS